MSTRELLFPSKDQLEKSRRLFKHVEFDPIHRVYRPTESVVQAAWDEIVDAGSAKSVEGQSQQ
jgi:hypothetical protein